MFEKGHVKVGGKKKGSKHKTSLGFLEILERNKFCPASALIECYQDARKVYDNYATVYEAICEAREQKGLYPTEDKAEKYLKMAIDCAKELASYSYSRHKAIEQIKPNPLEGLNAEQKLEAVKHMVRLLEMEVNGPGPVQTNP